MENQLDVLAGTAIDQLVTHDENQLLDAIDTLRSQGVGKLLGEAGLPQLIVCGDQSSGKSSVLEALTRVRFPTKISTCTTFATELRLRREPKSRISCRIRAAASRNQNDKERLARFQASFESPDKFPDLITAARNCMGDNESGNTSAFFNDVLEVEIVGPKLAPLTIVDLPGLIHYRSTPSGERDVHLVTSLVQSYMKQENSIILAVVSAHNDINNQVVLNHLKKIVPGGNRTLGIITKPDELPAGSEKEQEYLDHARTNPNKFQHGWHVVRNRTYGEQSSSIEERDKKEKDFFVDSNWNQLSRREVGLGIDSLRQKLSKMLLDHIALHLPSIVKRLEDDLVESERDLSKLGESRSTTKDRENYLSDISDKFGEYTKEALDGRYQRRSFFGDPSSPEGLEKRLRAKVRNLNDDFANRMLKQGHKWQVVEDSDMKSNIFGMPQVDHPKVIPRSVFLREHVDSLAHHERANELPGISNPLLIGSLFHQQSAPWEGIASAHLETVWKAAKEFLELLLSHLTDERTCNQVLIHIIDPAMEARRQAVEHKLEELLAPHRGHDPINIDPHFARKIWSLRERRVAESIVEKVRREVKASDGDETVPSVDKIIAKITATNALVDDKYGSNETFDFMQTYYETTILIFINNVASLAVEQCLLSGLPKIFSSATIRDLNDEKLELITAESRDTVFERERLTERIKALRNGLQTVKGLQPRVKRNVSKPSTLKEPGNASLTSHFANISMSTKSSLTPGRFSGLTSRPLDADSSRELQSSTNKASGASYQCGTSNVTKPGDGLFSNLASKSSPDLFGGTPTNPSFNNCSGKSIPTSGSLFSSSVFGAPSSGLGSSGVVSSSPGLSNAVQKPSLASRNILFGEKSASPKPSTLPVSTPDNDKSTESKATGLKISGKEPSSPSYFEPKIGMEKEHFVCLPSYCLEPVSFEELRLVDYAFNRRGRD